MEACLTPVPTSHPSLPATHPAPVPACYVQTRKMVHEKHVQTGLALETCVDELQRDFESAMEAVIGSIRNKHGVSEQQISEGMVANQQDAAVQGAVTALREAMNGKPPPGYRAAAEKSDAEAAKARVRRAGKQRRKG